MNKAYKTIILPVVLYICETWSLTLREECRLKIFENRILRKIFGSKRDVIRERRKLHSEELHRFFAVHLILDWMVKSRRLRWVGHLARMEEGRRAFKTLTDTPTGKRPLARQALIR